MQPKIMVKKPSNKNIKQFSFALKQIQILNFSLDNSPKYQILPPDHLYTFEINSRVLVDQKQEIIGVDLVSKIFTSVKKDDKVCELSLRISFSIKDFDKIIIKKAKVFEIPTPVSQHLIALTVSTARGILYEKVQGSFLSNVFLPIINVTKLKNMKTAKPLIK